MYLILAFQEAQGSVASDNGEFYTIPLQVLLLLPIIPVFIVLLWMLSRALRRTKTLQDLSVEAIDATRAATETQRETNRLLAELNDTLKQSRDQP